MVFSIDYQTTANVIEKRNANLWGREKGENFIQKDFPIVQSSVLPVLKVEQVHLSCHSAHQASLAC